MTATDIYYKVFSKKAFFAILKENIYIRETSFNVYTMNLNNLIAVYQQRLNLKNVTFSKIDHEDAMVAIVYKVTLANGENYILKICTREKDYLHETYFLNYFAGLLPVPRIIEVISPEVDLYGAVLMECLPGTLLHSRDISPELAYKIGSLFAQIHCYRTQGYGDLTQPDTLTSDSVAYFTKKFEESFAECSNHLSQSLLEKCRNYFEMHSDLLTSIDGPCITHRDFRPGNIIIHNGKLQGIIDWSSACASFAQEDFCSIEHGTWLNPANKKSFFAGYESIRKVPDYSTIMPLLRLNKAIATIGFLVKNNTWRTVNASFYQLNRQFLENFFSNND